MDSQAGLSHCSSPGRPSSLDIRMTTCLGFGFSGKVSRSGERVLSGSKLESIAGGTRKSRQLFKASCLITESGSRKLGGVGHSP